MEMDFGKAKNEDDTKCEIVFKNELVDFRCGELEERSKKAEARCVELELDIQKKKSEYEVLEDKFRALEVDKLAIEEELKVLKRKNDETKEHVDGVEGETKDSSRRERDVEKIVDLTEENEEEDKVVQLLIENKVLECEKKKAESEVKVWKQRFKELESQVLRLDENSFVRYAEQPLMGGTKIEGIRPRDGSHDETDLDYMQNNANVESLVDVGSTFCHSPSKGTVDLQAAGTKLQDIKYLCFLFLKMQALGG